MSLTRRRFLKSSLVIGSSALAADWHSALAAGQPTTKPSAKPVFKQCSLTPAVIAPGQPCVLRAEWREGRYDGIELRQTYFVSPEGAMPGFTYDAAARVNYLADPGRTLIAKSGPLDKASEPNRIEVHLDTKEWKPGVYFFLAGIASGKKRLDQRGLAVKVCSPSDRLDVSVSESWELCPGTHAERVLRLASGTLLTSEYISTDSGQTWRHREGGTIGDGGTQLRDGRVIGMKSGIAPIEGRDGWYMGQRFESTDDGRTIAGPLPAEFHVPRAKAAYGHAFHPGPIFMRSIVERSDGSLVALMAGWFKGDDEICPHGNKRPYSRTYVCESADRGRTWTYLATIGYDRIGSEGYNEGSMRMLPDGTLMAVMRTGSARDLKCQDNPVMSSFSRDGGRTWSKPQRTGGTGAFPDLLVLADGTLAASYGRPGNVIMFSADHGRTWIDHTIVNPTPYSGYTALCEPKPGEILIVFGAKDYFDPTTGRRKDSIRCARVTYRLKTGNVPQTRPASRAD
ncbi:MAG: exo-alpha-sialidase [Phycisphaerae bacterium]|nr:exo-alpha-sialidase [Phycisphaerae bacterium]